jgi:predicted nuclease of predicted toxin-antitoxin system
MVYRSDMRWQDYITATPDVRRGKPCIAGTRITVSDVLDYLRDPPRLSEPQARAFTGSARVRRGARTPAGCSSVRVMLLFDENLSPRLALLLGDRFPGCVHVDSVGLRGAPDGAVWDYAEHNALAIVSKDADFVSMALMRTAPMKVICLWCAQNRKPSTLSLRPLP